MIMLSALITLTLFAALYIFWPPDILSTREVTPYISELDVGIIWILVFAWGAYAIYYGIKEWKGGENGP